MADEQPDTSEKTEDPTQKRLDEALKRGDVVKSQEVSTWFIMAGATLVLMAIFRRHGCASHHHLRGLIANAYDISIDGPALPRLFEKIGGELIAASRHSVPAADARGAWRQSDPAQVGVVVRDAGAETLAGFPSIAGFKRMFSTQAIANFAKGLVKLFAGWRRADRGDVA